MKKNSTQNLDDLTVNIYNDVADKYENKNSLLLFYLFSTFSLFLWSHMLDLEVVLIVNRNLSSLVFNDVPLEQHFLLNAN